MSEDQVKHNISKAGGIMVASLFLSRILGLVRDMVILGRFGRNEATDAYSASFQIPDLLFYLIAGGALSSAFIPVFSEYLHTKREDEAWKVFSVVVTVMSVVVFAFIAASWVFAEPMVRLVAAGTPPEWVPVVAQMSRIIVPAQFAFFIGGIMIGTLYARNVFTVPGLAPNIYNIGIIFGALVVSNFVVPGVVGMSWGALVGAFIGNILIPLFVIRKMGMQFRVSFDVKHEGVKKVFRLMIPVVLGLSLPGIFSFILRDFGSFYGKGSLIALDTANRLMQAPLGVFGQALALAAFPVLAQLRTQDKMDQFSDQLSKSLRTVLFLSVPVSVLFVAVPLPIVTALFVRGEFTIEDARHTAPLLQMFGLGVAAWCLQPTLMRAYYAIQKTWPPVVMGTLTTLVFVGGLFLLSASKSGVASLPLAASVAAIFLAAMMLFAVNRTVCTLDIKGVLTTIAKAVAASVVASGFAWWALSLVPAPSGTGTSLLSLGSLLFVMCCFGWIYYLLAKALKMPETEYVNRAMNKRRRPSEPTV